MAERGRARPLTPTVRDDVQSALSRHLTELTGGVAGGAIGGALARGRFNRMLKRNKIGNPAMRKDFKRADRLFRRGATVAGASGGVLAGIGAGGMVDKMRRK